MIVYMNGKQIVVETNLAFAVPYWTERKRLNKAITWRIVK
jgi:hypothetical protein